MATQVQRASSFQHDRRVIIYPAYIDSGKTVAEGRRLAKPLACSEPNVAEIHDACRILGLKSEIQDKTYPRDFFMRGRVRVEYKTAGGTLMNSHIPDRRALMIKIAEIVPKHPNRSKRLLQEAQDKAKALEAASSSEAAAATKAAGGSKAGGSNNKKKNKK